MLLANRGIGNCGLGLRRVRGLGAAAVWLPAGLLLGLLPGMVLAQDVEVPDAPSVTLSAQAQHPQDPGSVSGTVIDSDGDAIAGAQVTLAAVGATTQITMVADGRGYFSFAAVPAGSFNLAAGYTGFATAVRPVTVHPGEDVDLEEVVLAVASEAMNVDVSPQAQYAMAELNLHVEEKQRLGGLIPNFYVIYDHHAPPLTAGQKFRLASRAVIDPANFVLSGIYAGVEQGTNAFSGFGQGAQGYGKRYGAALADNTVGTFLGGAVFPSLLRQDPRYFYKGRGSVISRALYALATAVICKGDNGKWQPNYSSVLADVAAGAVSNTYYPSTDRNGPAETIEIGLLNAAEDGVGNLLQEFLFKKITPGSRGTQP